jgi:hypothetical protein
MALSDDIMACLNEEAEQVRRPLQAEGYVRRRVFREGDDPLQVVILDMMQRRHGKPSDILTDRDFCLPVTLGSDARQRRSRKERLHILRIRHCSR